MTGVQVILLLIIVAAILFLVFTVLRLKRLSRKRIEWVKNLKPLDEVRLMPTGEYRIVYKNTLDGYVWLYGDALSYSRFEKVHETYLKPVDDEEI